MQPALQVRGLFHRYGDHVAVDGLSLDVAPGEVLGLVGPNGAGKTTTLRAIAGVLPIQDGSVHIQGVDLERDEAGAKQLMAWVPDEPKPFDTLTVMEHLEFTAALYGVHDWEPQAEALLARLELTEKRDVLGGELSRGMRQKLAIASAWLSQPSLVLLDEPLSGLDPRGIRNARAAIAELSASGVAVILSSHLLELIEALADRILILDHGRVAFVGTLAEARESRGAGSLEEIFLAVTGDDAQAAPASPAPEATREDPGA
tara:strand:- start:1656 stop:2435 length:780 start_codon:yes stop_codon:yes gene_type:complete